MENLGELAAIWRYPVKSLRGESLATVRVEEGGLPGDRASALFVREGHVRVGKTLRGKEHERLHLMEAATQGVASAAERGITVDVHSEDAHYFDAFPISIIVDRWLDDLSAHLGYAVEYTRFRPNFFVKAGRDFRALEADLIGRELLIGGTRLGVRDGIERCVTISYDPRGGPQDPRVLRELAQDRQSVMGIYCEALQPGVVRVGDSVYGF